MERLIRILIIDDDEVDRMAVVRALKGSTLNYTVTEAQDAELGINSLAANSYDCVFLDYLLPGTDGLTLLKKVRGLGIKTPIVIITSQGDEKIAVEMMKAGASDYVIKTQINAHGIAQILRNVIKLQDMERQREETEMALKISEARLAEAQKIARIGNWEFNFNTKAIYWSEEVYRIFNVDPAVFTPAFDNYLSLLHPDDISLVKSTVNKVNIGDHINIDFRIPLKGGNIKFVTAHGYLVLDADQKVEKLIGTIQDITSRKLVEKELIEAKQTAEESMMVKERFLANMSHEIRTPMNAIIGFTRLLMQQDLSAEQKKYIDAIHYSGENLLVIINDILDFSKIQSGKLTLEETYFYLPEILSPLLDIFEPKAKEKNIELLYELENTIPLSFKGDPVRLNQVLLNLFSNAVKFTENGYIKLQVRVIRYDDHEAMMEFVVEDSGIGIPKNKLTSIFDSFTQASSDTTRKYGGTGLGLTIVKSIIELQEGSIEVKSKVGKGTAFTILLPFKRSALPSKEQKHEAKHLIKDEITEAMKGINILLVEDSKMNQLLANLVLTRAGCHVTLAENGVIAVESLKNNSFDIILMDIQMPEMDGYQATHMIRYELGAPYSEIPIMAMTAHALTEEKDKCLEAGMNDYISKPFEVHELFSKVVALVKKDNVISMLEKH